MAKCRDDCSGRYEYQYFDAKNRAQLESALKSPGKDGFRVAPEALPWRPHLLELDTRKRRSYSYRVLEPKNIAELEQQLNDADADGFVPLGYVKFSGGSTGGELLILEKEGTTSATP